MQVSDCKATRVAQRSLTWCRGDKGFTVVELLTALSVLAVLIAMLLPAIQQARAAAQRTTCSSNLRQISVAAQAYESAYGRYPPASETFVLPRGGLAIGGLSPHARLLPFIDYTELYHRITWSWDKASLDTSWSKVAHVRVALFRCTSDGQADGMVNYRMCLGFTSSHKEGVVGTPDDSALGVARIDGVRTIDVSDGLSQTAFFSERIVGDFDDHTFTASRDVAQMTPTADSGTPSGIVALCRSVPLSPFKSESEVGGNWLFTDFRSVLYSHLMTPNSAVPDCSIHHGPDAAITARSFHSGGVFVANGDSSVRFVNSTVDERVWAAAATINRGER